MLTLSTISVSCYHLDYLFHDISPEEEAGTLALFQERMYALRAGLIKNATSKWDSTNANLRESTNVFHSKIFQIRMVVLFVCILEG